MISYKKMSKEQWWDVRNQLLGLNYVKQNVHEAVRRAARCKDDEEAQWLVRAAHSGTWSDRDSLVQCLVSYIVGHYMQGTDSLYGDHTELVRWIAFGRLIDPKSTYPLSMPYNSRRYHNHSHHKQAAEAGEPFAYYYMGDYGRAALAGHVKGMVKYATYVLKGDERWSLLAKAHTLGYVVKRQFLAIVCNDPPKLLYDKYMVVCMIRRGKIDINCECGNKECIKRRVHQWTVHFTEKERRAKRACDAWSIVGRRLGLYRDVILLISQQVWSQKWNWHK